MFNESASSYFQALPKLAFRHCKACHYQTLWAAGLGAAGRHTLEGH